MTSIQVIDSHTGGEPTRTVVEGGPDLGNGSMAERLAIFRASHDRIRSTVVNEPRGSDVMVGALLCEPVDERAAAGVIFFNNVGYLGMCGHGTIGVVETLRHMGRIGPGSHVIETPVGDVTAVLHEDGSVSIENVPSYRWITSAVVEVAGHGPVRGDVAWGGNWFFLVWDHGHQIALEHCERLTEFTWRIRESLEQSRITGRDGAEIDHVELFGPPTSTAADSKNFVLCPGKAYDRSPCGTGTSAKLACLAANGDLAEGAVYRQESIVGSIFEGSFRRIDGDRIIPTVKGRAWVNAESRLILNETDPFREGIRVGR